MSDEPQAETNGYQLKRQLAAERAGDDSVPSPDRSGPAFERRRPLLGGQCIGPRGSSFGTLGPLTRATDPHATPEWAVWADSASSGDRLVTTNRHVASGSIGQAIYQPGIQPDPDPDDRIGEVVGFARLTEPTAPDVAFIALDDGVEFGGWLADGMGQSVFRGDGSNLVGDDSRLCGANSGVATGTIEDGHTSLDVRYGGAWGTIEKRGVYRATDNSRGGDSGSPSDDGPSSGVLHGLNFASEGGFDPGASSELDSWKVPASLVEQAGVRVLSNDERKDGQQKENTTMTESIDWDGFTIPWLSNDQPQPPSTDREGHRLDIEGHGERLDWQVHAGTVWFRGDGEEAADSITGQPGSMTASGQVVGGVEHLGYHGERSVSLSLVDSDRAVTVDDVTIRVKPEDRDWVDWTEETLRDQPTAPVHPTEPPAEWSPISGGNAGRRWRQATPQYSQVNRYDSTTRDRLVTIDPALGAWAGEYSAGDAEYGSLTVAANYVETDVNHLVRICLPEGRLDSEPGNSVTLGPHVEHPMVGAQLHVTGDLDNPGDHVLSIRQLNTKINSAAPYHRGGATFEGFVLDGKHSGYGDCVGFQGVDIHAGDTFALGGYCCYSSYHNGRVTGRWLSKLKEGSVRRFSGATIETDDALVKTGIGGGKIILDEANSIDVGAGVVQRDGDPARAVVEDPHGQLDGVDPGFADVRGP